LRRSHAVEKIAEVAMKSKVMSLRLEPRWGLAKLNPVDPWLEIAWFQPLIL
jgi:hypothetical protein